MVATAAGKPCGVCGELAGDHRATPLLLGLGVTELSMSAGSLGYVKREVRRTLLEDAHRLADTALSCATTEGKWRLRLTPSAALMRTHERAASAAAGAHSAYAERGEREASCETCRDGARATQTRVGGQLVRLHPIFRDCAGVIFDLNGVLVQDEPLHEAAFREVLAIRGISVSHAEFSKLYLGRPDEDGVKLAAARARTHLTVEEVVAAKRARYRQLVQASGAKGTVESKRAVEVLRAAGLRLALATASPADEVAFWLEAIGLARVFKPVVHRDNSPEPKPSPTVYMTILRAWHAAPKDCVVLDDHPENIDIARSLGLRTVAVATSFDAGQFDTPDVVIHSLAELHADAL